MNRFRCSYVICSTQRSGSTLLCDLLKNSKDSGNPDSFFMEEFYPDWADFFGLSIADWPGRYKFDQAYVDAVLNEGAGDTSTFGMRLQQSSVEHFLRRLEVLYSDRENDSERVKAAFATSHYIHLSREDKIAQAISLYRAEQSGLWHINSDGSERERLKNGCAPIYNANAIAKLVALLEKQDMAWRTWFSRQNIQPIPITYESLSWDPANTLKRILLFLGLDAVHCEVVQPRTSKMANNESKQWAERFRAEKLYSLS